MAHIKMGAELRIGDIKHAGQKGKTEALMGKEGDPVVVLFFNHVLARIAVVLVAEGGKKSIALAVDALNGALEIVALKIGMLIPAVAKLPYLSAAKELAGLLMLKEPSPADLILIQKRKLHPAKVLMGKLKQNGLNSKGLAGGLSSLPRSDGG